MFLCQRVPKKLVKSSLFSFRGQFNVDGRLDISKNFQVLLKKTGKIHD